MIAQNLRTRDALRALTASPVAWMVIGSAGLALRLPDLFEAYPLPDADLWVSGADDALTLGRWMAERGCTVTCWGAAWSPAWVAADLAQKSYLQAIFEGIKIDMTFEGSALAGLRCDTDAEWIDGLPLCPLEPLWRSKILASPESARRFAKDFGLTIPDGCEVPTVRAPTLDTRRETLEEHGRDFGLRVQKTPVGVVVPESVEAVAEVLRWASATRARVVVQGGRRSSAGQALGEAVVVSTARLQRIFAVEDGAVTVEAGVRWDVLVRALLPLGWVPPVLTSYLPATVGGTLSAPSFSRGSQHHGLQIEHVRALEVVTAEGRVRWCSPTHARWLFDAVLGGLGRFGAIVRATLSLVAAPTHLRVERSFTGDLGALCAAWREAAEDPRGHHVTAFPTVESGGVRWGCVKATVASPDDSDVVSFERYAVPPRPERPSEAAQWLHVMVPLEALERLLAHYARCLALSDGDGVQVLPIRKRRDLTESLARMPEVPDGSLVAGVCLVRELRGRDPTTLDRETRALYQWARALGAVSTLGGTLPKDLEGWREHLGPSAERVLATLERADPQGIFGGIDGASSEP